jgi:hypothetical protein
VPLDNLLVRARGPTSGRATLRATPPADEDSAPGRRSASSARAYPEKLPQPEYPAHFEVRKVSRNGGIRFRCNRSRGPNQPWLNVSHVLAEEYVGLEEVEDGIWAIYFGPLLLGRFDEREKKLYGNLRSMTAATKQLSLCRWTS